MKTYIQRIINDTITKLNYPAVDFSVEQPKDEKFGDYSANIAMMLARPLKSNPRKIAQEISDNLIYDKDNFEKIEIAGAGFLNFYFSKKYFQKALNNIISEGKNFGRLNLNAGRKVNVEWVSANPTKPLHSGHGRQICLGKAIANMLEWSGFEVTREYYYNDAGNQMNMLAKSIYARYMQLYDSSFPFPENGYQGDYIKDIAKEIQDKFGDKYKGAESDDFFREYGEKYNFNLIRKTLHRLGIEHDIFFSESSLYKDGSIQSLLDEFKKRNLSYEKDGAVWLKGMTDYEHEKDKVIIKSTGEYTYRLPDMAYHINKIKRGYDCIIDIFGADHGETYKEVLHGIQMAGYDISKIKVIIHQMVTFRMGDESVKMSGRFGTFYSLDDLLDDIGVDATQFFFIMRGANSQLDFDIKLAKEQSDKNPVYYLQYAHARICGILRHSDEISEVLRNVKSDLSLLKEKDEIELIKMLTMFPESLEEALEFLEPHKIITYLNNVAAAFHRFYRNSRVINSDNPEVTSARLSLCLATRQVLQNGFSIIGISAPERMEKE
jgi:arginyl-tRNA synthetase